MNQPQSRPCSGMKTLKRCKSNVDADNFVLIDVDSDGFENVIIIDVPEGLKRKLRGSSGLGKDKNIPLETVICIDDDDSTDNHHPGTGLEGDGDFGNGASSSMKFGPSTSHTRRTVNAVGSQFNFAQENISPVKLSKCKRTYSGKTSSNRYGLSMNSDSDSSDNDFPDCEVMEDSSGKFREQWERASSKRKSDVQIVRSGMREQGRASMSSAGAHQDVGADYPGVPISSSPRKASCEKDDQSPSVAAVNNLGSTSCDPKKSPFADTDLNLSQKAEINHENADIPASSESLRKDSSYSNAEQHKGKIFEHGGSSFYNLGQNDRAPTSSPSKRKSSREANSQWEDGTPEAEPTPNSEPSVCHSMASLPNDEGLCQGQHSVETEFDHGPFVFGDRGEKCEQAPSNNNSQFLSESDLERCKFKQNEKFDSRKSVPEDTQLSDGELFNHRVSPSRENIEAFFKEAFSSEYPSLGKPGISNEKNFCQGKDDLVWKEPSFCNIHIDETQLKRGNSLEGKEVCMELVPNCREDERNDLLHTPDGEATPAVESSIINEREKLKETDEYKRALEEEWSSRQRSLKIQAEEAQQLRRLRKRQRAESMRLLDMERRQKQRVEEIRESQKKVEENMTLRELHRAEVRKELKKLESACRDMASLLRGLRIQVGGGLHPLAHEVRAAYKRALFSFHPDRASGSDMRQQVEAEEKFKLISRMKEKFLPS